MKPHTPVHQWIAVLDLEGFSDRPDPIQASQHDVMFSLARQAMQDAYVDWDALGVKDEGDGMILFFPADISPVRIAGDVVRCLNAVLDEAATSYSQAHRMRFRLSLHHGMATPDGGGWPGEATNTACRLVDAQLLRDVLAAAPRAHLAVIASDDFYRSVIRPGHRSIDPAAYARVEVDLKKAPGTCAWVYVPGYPTPPGLPGGDQEEPARPVQDASAASSSPAATPSLGRPSATTQIYGGDHVVGVKNVYNDNRQGGSA